MIKFPSQHHTAKMHESLEIPPIAFDLAFIVHKINAHLDFFS